MDLGFCFFKGEGAAAERIDFLGFPLFPLFFLSIFLPPESISPPVFYCSMIFIGEVWLGYN